MGKARSGGRSEAAIARREQQGRDKREKRAQLQVESVVEVEAEVDAKSESAESTTSSLLNPFHVDYSVEEEVRDGGHDAANGGSSRAAGT
eukprot:3681325-Amphidinium_carterae.1